MQLMKIRRPKRLFLEDYVQDIKDEMENLFKSTFEGVSSTNGREEEGEYIYKPPIKLCEKNGNYQLQAQLPGINKENIDVEVTEDCIKIRAEFKEEKIEEEENLYRSEFHYGKFMRKIPLPEDVISEQAEAKYENGILTISAPKLVKEEKQVTKLTIS